MHRDIYSIFVNSPSIYNTAKNEQWMPLQYSTNLFLDWIELGLPVEDIF